MAAVTSYKEKKLASTRVNFGLGSHTKKYQNNRRGILDKLGASQNTAEQHR